MTRFDKDKVLAIMRNGTDSDKERLVDEIARMLEDKKYGLVWEEGDAGVFGVVDAEDVDYRSEVGVLRPIRRKDLSMTMGERGYGNLLLEGDNYVWLNILRQTHRGKIDVIYIDPPYNTKKKDFRYNDRFVRKGDSFQHSGWLSFMSKRLRLARDLLKDDGVIFISCDDNEQAYLKLLCDEIFGEDNFVQNLIWQKKTGAKGVPPKNMSVCVHDYVLCYQKGGFRFKGLPRDDTQFSNPDNDSRGDWKADNMKSTVSKKKFDIVMPGTGWVFNDAWAFAPDTITRMIEEDRIIWPSKKTGNPRQKRFKSEYTNETKPLTSMIGTYQNGSASNRLTDMFGEKVFDYPKPVELIELLVGQHERNDVLVLDFFAGSGTTAHAVEQLNVKDGGNRHWILITSNESDGEEDGGDDGICRAVTKPRIDILLTGTRPDGSKYGEAIDSGYEYFQYEYARA